MMFEHILSPIKGKYVCANCFKDYAIAKYINSNPGNTICSYCGRTATSASLIDVRKYIMDGMLTEWVINSPEREWEAENLGWHGGRDGFIQSNALLQHLLPELRNCHSQLFNDLNNSIPGEWRPRKQYDPEPQDYFSYRWEEFSEAVKYKTRYVYYRINTDWQKSVARREKQTKFQRGYSHVLEEVLDNISELDLIHTVPTGTIIWRGRSHEATKTISLSRELGTPPFELSKSTRMSPAGIPVFYGSLDRQTAIEESLKIGIVEKGIDTITIGKWRTLQKFKLLNLAKISKIPSLFDANRRKFRASIFFLESFSNIVSEPLLVDGHDQIEYIPTQVFAEYIKLIYKDKNGDGVDGIIYRSSVRKYGINCVLFIRNAECLPASEITYWEKPVKRKLMLQKHERVPQIETLKIIAKRNKKNIGTRQRVP